MKKLDNLVVVATDVSAAKMARGYAKRLSGGLAIIDKRRPAPNQAEVANIVGEVEGKHCIIPDDMIDTAGTMATTVDVLRERGALDIYILATHPLFSGPAVERLAKAGVKEITVTDTVPIAPEKLAALPNLTVLSVASLLAQAIESTHTNSSVSMLFN
jgi:ribose-phosphate pyrophosphokinase